MRHCRGDDLEKKAIRRRRQVQQLYFDRRWSKKRIASHLRMSKHTVIRWTQSKGEDVKRDGRGWPKGKRRRWSSQTEKQVAAIHRYLSQEPTEFYTGASAIELEWRRRWPQEPSPPLRTIGQMMSDLGLTKSPKKRDHRGAAAYLCYPEHTIYQSLGGRVVEADFVGQKYLAGRSEPLHFIGFSFKQAPRLRYYQRVKGQTAKAFIDETSRFFERFEKPSFMKIDNCAATIGSTSGRRNISRVMHFLLQHQVVPIYSVPRKPFSQASIEGNNSVFARKFWRARHFDSLESVDQQLQWFNQSTLHYTGYQKPKCRQSCESFRPRVYCLRQVREDDRGRSTISVLNESLELDPSYVSYFVIAEWSLDTERLDVHFERDRQLSTIHSQRFSINASSKKRIRSNGGAVLSCI